MKQVLNLCCCLLNMREPTIYARSAKLFVMVTQDFKILNWRTQKQILPIMYNCIILLFKNFICV